MGDEDHAQAALPAQPVEDADDLGLDGDVQGRGGFVGEHQPGLGEQHRGDHDALQHPAGQLVGVLPQPPRRVVDAHLGEHPDGPGLGLAAAHAPVPDQRLDQERADAPGRVDVGPGVLEDHADAVVAVAAQRAGVHGGDVLAVEADAALDLGAARQQPGDGADGHGLAGAGLADQAEGLAGGEGQVDPVQDRPAGPGPGGTAVRQVHGDAAEFQQRGGGHTAAPVSAGLATVRFRLRRSR